MKQNYRSRKVKENIITRKRGVSNEDNPSLLIYCGSGAAAFLRQLKL